MCSGARKGRGAVALQASAGIASPGIASAGIASAGIAKHTALTLLVVVCVLAAGCVHPAALEPPKISIIGVHIVSSELWMQHLKVRLRLHNPNDRELPVTGVEYTIDIAGQELGSGSAAESFVVPPHGDAEFDSSVVTNLASAALKLLSHGPRTLVPYRLAGKVSLAQGLGRVPFEEQASFTP